MDFKPKTQKPALVVYGESVRLLPRSKRHQQNLLTVASASGQDELGTYSIIICFSTFGLISAAYDPTAVNLIAVIKHLTLGGGGGHSIASESQDINYWLTCTLLLLPNIVGGLVAATLCNLYPRSQLLGGLAVLASLASFLVAGAGAGHFASRIMAGVSMGGSVPVIYSLCGDWFAAGQRVKVCGFISSISGASLLLGQGIAAALGPARWRASCLLLACPLLAAGLLVLQSAEDPVRGGKGYFFDVLCRHHKPLSAVLSLSRAIRSIAGKRTNLLVFLQFFPGNIVLGIVLAGLNGFLREDRLLPPSSAHCGALVMLGAALAGMLLGGWIGEALYVMHPRCLALFSGACSVLRVLPLLLLLAAEAWGPAKHEGMRMVLFIFMGIAGVSTTASTPCLTAMLLNVNPAETRGLVIGLQAVFDEAAKVLGAFFVVLIVRRSDTWTAGFFTGDHHGTLHATSMIGFEMICWFATVLSVLSGIALLAASGSYVEEEALLKEQFEAAARQQKVRLTKQHAQMAVQRLARAAGEAHHTECKHAAAIDAETPALTLLHAARPESPANDEVSWQQWQSSTFAWLKDQQLAWSVILNLR